MSNFLNKKLGERLDLACIDTVIPKPKTNTLSPDVVEKFGLAELDLEAIKPVELTPETDKEDRELARAAIRNTLKITAMNLDGLMKMAQATEHPRAFEVAAIFAKSIIDAATKLDDLVDSSNKKNNTNLHTETSSNINQQNNIILSTEDAMKMIRDMTGADITKNK